MRTFQLTSSPIHQFANSLPDPSPWRRRVFERHDDRLAAIGARGEHHPVRLDPHQLRRLQVEHHDDRLADERVRFVRFGDAGDERALLGPDVDLQLEEAVRFWHAFRGDHLGHAQLDLHEVIHRDAVAGDGCERRCRWLCSWRCRIVGHGHLLTVIFYVATWGPTPKSAILADLKVRTTCVNSWPERAVLREQTLAISAPTAIPIEAKTCARHSDAAQNFRAR